MSPLPKQRQSRAFVVAAFLGAALGGCGGVNAPSGNAEAGDASHVGLDADAAGDDGASSRDAGPLDASNDDAAACVHSVPAGSACNALAPEGPTVVSACAAGSPPAAHGGPIPDGSYVLESIAFYGTCPISAEQGRITWDICSSSWTTVQELPAAPGSDAGFDLRRLGATASVQGASVVLTIGCDSSRSDPSAVTWGYTAALGHLTVFIPTGGTDVRVDTFRLK